MTRKADPNVKDNMHFRAEDENDEKMFSDFKKLAVQDGVKLIELQREGIRAVFKAHHWPPGNPQLQLSVFQTALPVVGVVEKCKCGRSAVVWATDLRGPTKGEYCFCQQCFSKVPLRFDPKIWKITLDRREEIRK
ncbi:MAG: hypothetical protein LBC12_00510 [Nitrososphaerota archaeon]|jgi:hypothetical protein|nr:hypothetical protein [Nitrososphaerota archaeon]